MDPQKLRAATREEHEATEALMPLMHDGLSRETYVATLGTLLPVVASWEAWAAAHAPAELRALLPARRRSQWLREDLAAMGAGAEGAEAQAGVDWGRVLASARKDVSAATFLGALYVMEGSTLGGRFLARHVALALGLEAGKGNRYFEGHGEATGAMWREVSERIREVPETEAEAVTEAARRTFAAFGDALKGIPVACGMDYASRVALT